MQCGRIGVIKQTVSRFRQGKLVAEKSIINCAVLCVENA